MNIGLAPKNRKSSAGPAMPESTASGFPSDKQSSKRSGDYVLRLRSSPTTKRVIESSGQVTGEISLSVFSAWVTSVLGDRLLDVRRSRGSGYSPEATGLSRPLRHGWPLK